MFDIQMQEAFNDPAMGLNAAEVQQNPDAFLRNPMKATSSNELREIYAFNEKVLELASQPIRAQEGMQVGEAPATPAEGADGPVGFVEQQPEKLDNGTKIADDVPVDVPEGSYVLNAAAVEFAGSEDVKKMILGAIDEAQRQGVDISGNVNKIDSENAVSLLVSRGEVLIPPVLAKIIGYDKLEKINNRGKQETEKRVAEEEQAPQEPQQAPNPAEGMAMREGGNTAQDTEIQDIYDSIVSQGGTPPEYDVFNEAMQSFRRGKVYRPMRSATGSEDFDAEVKSKYGLFFDDYDKKYMTPEEVEATSDSFVVASGPVSRQREDGSIYYIDPKTGQEVPNPDMGEEGFIKQTPAP
jgi:hypothetical protein